MIVPMTADHLPEVMAIDAQCYPIPWSREDYESELSRTGDRFYVIARPDRVAGHAGVAFEESEAHITTVTVTPDSRGQGIGARLFLALALAARRRNTFARNSSPGESFVRRPAGRSESNSKISRRAWRRPVSGGMKSSV